MKADELCAVCGENDCGSLMVNDSNQARIEHEPPYPLSFTAEDIGFIGDHSEPTKEG